MQFFLNRNKNSRFKPPVMAPQRDLNNFNPREMLRDDFNNIEEANLYKQIHEKSLRVFE